jgi:CpXC protein
MSIFVPVNAQCRKCGTEVHTDLAASVNVDRRPDLRTSILDGSFQGIICPGCATPVRLPAHMTYLDMARGQWILTEDVSKFPQWRKVEAEAQGLFDQAFGAEASEVAQQIGRELTPRLVFGWTALKEKLIAQEVGLDDVVLELLKISILKNVPGPPMADLTELRLVEASETMLAFRWTDERTEETLVELPMERDIYDALAGDLDNWAELKAQVEAGMFVDMRRLFMGEA